MACPAEHKVTACAAKDGVVTYFAENLIRAVISTHRIVSGGGTVFAAVTDGVVALTAMHDIVSVVAEQ